MRKSEKFYEVIGKIKTHKIFMKMREGLTKEYLIGRIGKMDLVPKDGPFTGISKGDIEVELEGLQ